MTREDIERKCLEYSQAATPSYTNGDFDRYAIAQAFEDGAEWRINSVWHTMDEVQDGKRPYIVQYNEEWKFAMFTKPISIPKEQAKSVFKRWAYMDDLIPDTED